MSAGRLAILGGEPVVPRQANRVAWPLVTEADEQAVLRCLRSGDFTTFSNPLAGEVKLLEDDWARYVGSRHCVAVDNGTDGLALALAAAGVEPGDEVIVPALSFIATALAPLHIFAVPVFVDVDPVTYNIDVARIEERISPRTRAIVPVHLHGLPAEMDSVSDVARRHGLHIVEDAAQAHGAVYHGRRVGTLGALAAFSLNASKNLPTCGEGGLVNTDSEELFGRVLRSRQFGEVVGDGWRRDYVHEALGWNSKLSSVQAAFARSQLQRLDAYQVARHRNVTCFLDSLRMLRGLRPPSAPSDRSHAWHILRFGVDPEEAGLDGVPAAAFRRALQRALQAEGVPVREYQTLPLPAQPVFRELRGLGPGYPWRLSSRSWSYRPEDCPVAARVVEETFTLQRAHLHPESGPLLDLYADAFSKVFEHLDTVGRIARGAR